MFQLKKKTLELPDFDSALPHRSEVIQPAPEHYVSGNRFIEPVPGNLQKRCLASVASGMTSDCFGSTNESSVLRRVMPAA